MCSLSVTSPDKRPGRPNAARAKTILLIEGSQTGRAAHVD